MGGPTPGIDGNIRITAVSNDGNIVTFRIPRYCAINVGSDPATPYFIPGFMLTMDAILEEYAQGKTKSFEAYVKTESTDYGLEGDIVDVTISAENGVLPPLAVGDLYSAHFINQYPVGQ